MAIATNNILRFTNFFLQGTIEAVMVSYWRVEAITTPNTYAAMAEAFHEVMMAVGDGATILSNSAKLYRTVVDNVTLLGMEGGEFNGDIVGTSSTDPAPSFNALSIRQAVEERITRNGYKRFPFIAEGTMNGNNAVLSGVVRSAIEAFWGDEVSFIWVTEDGSIDIDLQPVVVGRTETPPGSGNYEIDLTKINVVTGASVRGITSQLSRKS